MLGKQHAVIDEPVTPLQISNAKAELDSARRVKDDLRAALAEATLNSLLDRYHSSHT